MSKNKKIIYFIILMFAVLTLGVFAFSSQAWAAIYYVDDNACPNTGSGTVGSPYCEIQSAANIVNPGDTVIVKDGIYFDSDGDGKVLLVKRGGTNPGEWVTFRAENQWGAILDGNLNTSSHCIQAGQSVAFVKIEGFEIRECSNVGIQFPVNWSGDNWEITNNHIHHIGLRTKTTQWEMDNAMQGHDGIFIGRGTSHITISGNIIHHVGREACPECWNPSPGSPYFICSGCPSASQKHEYHHDHGIYLGKQVSDLNVSNITVTNNIFYENNNGYHFKLSPGNSDITFSGNTCFGANNNLEDRPELNRGGAIVAWHGNYGLTNITIDNNLFYYPTLDYVIWAFPVSGATNIVNFQLTNNKTTDSQMLDPRITQGEWIMTGNTVNATLPINQCLDGIDNDNDGLIDYPNDPGCSSNTDDDEFNAFTDTTPPAAPLNVSVQ